MHELRFPCAQDAHCKLCSKQRPNSLSSQGFVKVACSPLCKWPSSGLTNPTGEAPTPQHVGDVVLSYGAYGSLLNQRRKAYDHEIKIFTNQTPPSYLKLHSYCCSAHPRPIQRFPEEEALQPAPCSSCPCKHTDHTVPLVAVLRAGHQNSVRG